MQAFTKRGSGIQRRGVENVELSAEKTNAGIIRRDGGFGLRMVNEEIRLEDVWGD
jgi:hypothetical protein